MYEPPEEGMFPGIAFRGTDWERRAWVIGTALDVWQIVDSHRDFESVEAMAAETDVSERLIRLALAYYERFPEEIDEMIERNRATLEELQAQYPTINFSSDHPAEQAIPRRPRRASWP